MCGRVFTEVVDAYFEGINPISPERGAPARGVSGERGSEGGGVETRDVAVVKSVGRDFSRVTGKSEGVKSRKGGIRLLTSQIRENGFRWVGY